LKLGQKQAEKVLRLRVQNTSADPVLICLEPWGEQYTMPPGVTFEVVATGPEGDALEIQYAEHRITLFGWTGSIVRLFQDGIEVGA
jgi:hypothetical protein